MNDKPLDDSITSVHIWKFVIASVIGGLLFLVPVPYKETISIPLGIVIDWVSALLVVNHFNIAELLVLILISISTLLSILAYTIKPGFIMKNEKLKNLFLSPVLYFVSKLVGCVFIWLIYFKIGPAQIHSGATGGAMLDVSGMLVSVVLVIAFTMPLLTEFGIMEFFGVMLRNVVRLLFTCPGRSSVDLMTSWFGASNASVILTRGQYERGFYTGREAATICTNFSIVSLPFCYVIAKMIGIEAHFPVWYLILLITCMSLAIVTPRIWPLCKMPDTYDEIAGKQINEVVPENVSTFQWALTLTGKRAKSTTGFDVVKYGLNCYLTLFMDLIPLVIAWGTVALIIVEFTPIFTIISVPMGWYLSLFGIEGARELAPTAFVGFVDMYIPALMLSGEAIAYKTKFVLGALSLIQIIYMTEVGILIVKSRIPMNVWQLFIVFIERTLLSLPIIVVLAELFVRF